MIYSDSEKLAEYARQIHASGIDLTPDQRVWTEIAYACASQGEAGREPYHLISSNYPGYSREECDKHYSYCLKTSKNCVSLGTLVKIAKDNGVELTLPRGRRKKTAMQKKEEQRAMVCAVKDFLMEGRQWRFNILSNKTEYSEDGSVWKEVDDRFMDTVLTRMRESGMRVKDNEVRSLVNSSDFAPDFAPHVEWLRGLPEWNPDTDPDYIHDFFVGHMDFGPMADVELYDQMFHRWLVGMVALWLGDIDANPVMPSYCGPEHVGKSYMAQHVLPPCLQQYQTTIRPNDPFNTDTMLTLSEVLLVIFDEIAISSDSKSNMMKYLITSGQTNLRDAYGHYRKARRRIASPIATTNHHQFIRESDGSRRYLSIDLVGTKNLQKFPLNYEGAYAQALYLLKHGYDPTPTYDESRRLNKYNKQFMIPNDCEEALRTFVRQPEDDDVVVKGLSSGDLLHELNGRGFRGKEFNVVSIGRAMKSMGFVPFLSGGRSKYRVVLLDFEHQEREQKAEAADAAKASDNQEKKEDSQEQKLPF